jgi:hypothetical protein
VLTGRILAVRNNAELKSRVMAHKEFDTLATADAWLNGKANITTTTPNV